jgi:hypothetical protein
MPWRAKSARAGGGTRSRRRPSLQVALRCKPGGSSRRRRRAGRCGGPADLGSCRGGRVCPGRCVCCGHASHHRRDLAGFLHSGTKHPRPHMVATAEPVVQHQHVRARERDVAGRTSEETLILGPRRPEPDRLHPYGNRRRDAVQQSVQFRRQHLLAHWVHFLAQPVSALADQKLSSNCAAARGSNPRSAGGSSRRSAGVPSPMMTCSKPPGV